MIGGSLFYDFARVGATPAPFQSFVLSAGVVTDYVYGAGMHWQGGCGGFPCDGSGSLNEWNVIDELKAATPLGGGNTLNGRIELRHPPGTARTDKPDPLPAEMAGGGDKANGIVDRMPVAAIASIAIRQHHRVAHRHDANIGLLMPLPRKSAARAAMP
jgi:hypothetical protein